VSGKISTLGPREGDTVTAGQRVGTLDRFEQAQRDYDRTKRLISAGGSTQQQVEHAGTRAARPAADISDRRPHPPESQRNPAK